MDPVAIEQQDTIVIERFVAARRDPRRVVLEGLHALKHALRFGARVECAISPDVSTLVRIAAQLAPDERERIEALTTEVPAPVYAAAAPRPPQTGVVAVAERPLVDLGKALADSLRSPAILLERPRSLGNLGAAVRVAAAAGAAAVLTTGSSDPWDPAALRGSAGLHYALPVGHVAELPPSDRPLIAFHPDGDPLSREVLPPRSVFAFGGERHGLSDELLARADSRVRIPMRPGVSSLNLATAVAAVLYSFSGTSMPPAP